jgi:hypothetical protein
MTGARKVLFAVGSQKITNSTSLALANYLGQRLDAHHVAHENIHVIALVRKEDRRDEFFAAIDSADTVVLVFPLFVDSQPWSVVRFMELVAEHRKAGNGPPQRLAAMVNSGFPEAHQNETALAICRQFALESNMTWAGGLALGGGGGVGGKPLEKAGPVVKPVMKALDMTADALAAGEDVPPEAIALMAKPLVPHWAYRIISNIGFWVSAWRNGVLGKLRARPFRRPVEHK